MTIEPLPETRTECQELIAVLQIEAQEIAEQISDARARHQGGESIDWDWVTRARVAKNYRLREIVELRSHLKAISKSNSSSRQQEKLRIKQKRLDVHAMQVERAREKDAIRARNIENSNNEIRRKYSALRKLIKEKYPDAWADAIDLEANIEADMRGIPA